MLMRTAKLSTAGAALALSLGAFPAHAETKFVKLTITTNPSTTEIRNLDVLAGLPFGKLKTYTVTISPMIGFPKDVSRAEVRFGVLNGAGTAAIQAVALSRDAYFLGIGTTISTFTGTNCFVRIQRGADGLGTREVHINALVETEP